MIRKSSKAMAALLGLRRIKDSSYYESEPDGQSKVTIACYNEGEFHKIGVYATNNKRMIALYIDSLDAVYLSCADGQFLINQDGTILSAPGNFEKIHCLKETGINGNIALLQVAIGEDEQNVAIVRRDGNGGYKWGLLFPDGKGDARIIGDSHAIAKKGSDVLFLETVARTKAYSYVVPVMMRGSPEAVFLKKENGSYEAHEYEVWINGALAWAFEASRRISYALFISGRPWMAQIKCWGAEGLIDLKRKEIILPTEYKKVSVEEGDYAYVITHGGVKCLYDLAEDRWIVAESDGWSRSEKGKGAGCSWENSRGRRCFGMGGGGNS